MCRGRGRQRRLSSSSGSRSRHEQNFSANGDDAMTGIDGTKIHEIFEPQPALYFLQLLVFAAVGTPKVPCICCTSCRFHSGFARRPVHLPFLRLHFAARGIEPRDSCCNGLGKGPLVPSRHPVGMEHCEIRVHRGRQRNVKKSKTDELDITAITM